MSKQQSKDVFDGAFVVQGNRRFLIMGTPTNDNVNAYVEQMKEKKVTTLVHACHLTYSTDVLKKNDIKVVDCSYPDGDPPPDDKVSLWLDEVEEVFGNSQTSAIAVHCVAGLGRAPVLAAIAFIEDGMEPGLAMQKIRDARRGAINKKQVDYLMSYVPRRGRKNKSCCVVC